MYLNRFFGVWVSSGWWRVQIDFFHGFPSWKAWNSASFPFSSIWLTSYLGTWFEWRPRFQMQTSRERLRGWLFSNLAFLPSIFSVFFASKNNLLAAFLWGRALGSIHTLSPLREGPVRSKNLVVDAPPYPLARREIPCPQFYQISCWADSICLYFVKAKNDKMVSIRCCHWKRKESSTRQHTTHLWWD